MKGVDSCNETKMDLLPLYQKTFDQGWIREVVYRKNGQRCDIYYRKATQKLRSSREVVTYLAENEGTNLLQDNFSWKCEPLGIGEPVEVVRRSSAEPIKKSKKKLMTLVLKKAEHATGKSVVPESNLIIDSQISTRTVEKKPKKGKKNSKKKIPNSNKSHEQKVVSTDHDCDCSSDTLWPSSSVIEQNEEEEEEEGEKVEDNISQQCKPCPELFECDAISDVFHAKANQKRMPVLRNESNDFQETGHSKMHAIESDENEVLSLNKSSKNRKRKEKIHEEPGDEMQKVTKKLRSRNIPLASKGETEAKSTVVPSKVETEAKSTVVPSKVETEAKSTVVPSKVEAEAKSTVLPSKGEAEAKSTVLPSKGEAEAKSTVLPSKGEAEAKSTVLPSKGEAEAKSTVLPSKGEAEAKSTVLPSKGEAEAKSTVLPSKGEAEAKSTVVTSKGETEAKDGNVPEPLDLNLVKPTGLGWKREVVYRKSKAKSQTCDVYYYSPELKKFRSSREIERHDLGNNLSAKNFSFVKHPLGLPPGVEMVRRAK